MSVVAGAVEFDAKDLYSVYLHEMWCTVPSFGKAWEHLTERERRAWELVAEVAVGGRMRIDEGRYCEYCKTKLECSVCVHPECPFCDELLICPDCFEFDFFFSTLCVGECR
jgi:hypothetical protein